MDNTTHSRLRQARKHLSEILGKKITQKKLASMCGWESGQSRVGNYETNLRRPGASDVETIARVTGVRAEWLQFGTGPMTDDEQAEPQMFGNDKVIAALAKSLSESQQQIVIDLMQSMIRNQ